MITWQKNQITCYYSSNGYVIYSKNILDHSVYLDGKFINIFDNLNGALKYVENTLKNSSELISKITQIVRTDLSREKLIKLYAELS